MGVEFYIVRHDTKQLFDLGRYIYSELTDDFDWLYDRSILLERVVRSLGWNENIPAGYCLYVRDKIWDFCQGLGNEKDIDVVSEHALEDPPYRHSDDPTLSHTDRWTLQYEVAGSRYAKNDVWMECIRNNYNL